MDEDWDSYSDNCSWDCLFGVFEMKKHLLFICSSNLDRSPAAEELFKDSDKYESKSAGVGPFAEKKVDQDLVEWADIIFVMDEDNVKNLKKNAWIVWLNGESEVIRERMDKEQRSGKIRPSLTGEDPLEEIKQVMDVRIPLYEKAATLVVDTSTVTPEEVAALIIKNIPKGFKT